MKGWSMRPFPGCGRRMRNAGLAAVLALAAALATSWLAPDWPVYAQTVGTPPLAVEGYWLAQDRDGVFLIGHCGGGQLCGRLVGLDYDAEMPKDVWGRPECGLVMLTGFTRQDDGRWHGTILDPQTGRQYDSMIWSPQRGVLKLRGYILGIPFLGETQSWTRYAGPPMGAACKMPKP
ncbi:uncharacterized protein (DUF2147 family) [Acidomonas methanolica]|nr:uncharacterized protein (DUF2147 family) [Acidomonas methanolica]